MAFTAGGAIKLTAVFIISATALGRAFARASGRNLYSKEASCVALHNKDTTKTWKKKGTTLGHRISATPKDAVGRSPLGIFKAPLGLAGATKE
ncbi:hypothetical protein T492DRAFT_886723 [Pavlovales sp. CCMP2436]|nr:hypothetical protein T492DRAFT_886723 [Pavlovales sp. CCMP2436]